MGGVDKNKKIQVWIISLEREGPDGLQILEGDKHGVTDFSRQPAVDGG